HDQRISVGTAAGGEYGIDDVEARQVDDARVDAERGEYLLVLRHDVAACHDGGNRHAAVDRRGRHLRNDRVFDRIRRRLPQLPPDERVELLRPGRYLIEGEQRDAGTAVGHDEGGASDGIEAGPFERPFER